MRQWREGGDWQKAEPADLLRWRLLFRHVHLLVWYKHASFCARMNAQSVGVAASCREKTARLFHANAALLHDNNEPKSTHCNKKNNECAFKLGLHDEILEQMQ